MSHGSELGRFAAPARSVVGLRSGGGATGALATRRRRRGVVRLIGVGPVSVVMATSIQQHSTERVSGTAREAHGGPRPHRHSRSPKHSRSLRNASWTLARAAASLHLRLAAISSY